MLNGEGVVPGRAIGRVVIGREESIDFNVYHSNSAKSRLTRALNKTVKQLKKEEKNVKYHSYLKFQILILEDKKQFRSAYLDIDNGMGLLEAIQKVEEKINNELSQASNERTNAKKADVKDAFSRLYSNLGIKRYLIEGNMKSNCILVSDQIMPSTLLKNRNRIRGVISVEDSKAWHYITIAESKRIPVIKGKKEEFSKLSVGSLITIDGETGRVYEGALKTNDFKVSSSNIEIPESLVQQGKVFASIIDRNKRLPAWCAGIGLIRTEYLYMQKGDKLSEGELAREYKKIVSLADGKRVIIRTTDFSGDKRISCMDCELDRLGFPKDRLLDIQANAINKTRKINREY